MNRRTDRPGHSAVKSGHIKAPAGGLAINITTRMVAAGQSARINCIWTKSWIGDASYARVRCHRDTGSRRRRHHQRRRSGSACWRWSSRPRLLPGLFVIGEPAAPSTTTNQASPPAPIGCRRGAIGTISPSTGILKSSAHVVPHRSAEASAILLAVLVERRRILKRHASRGA